MPEENLTTSDIRFTPTLLNQYPFPDAKFNGQCLINNNFFTHGEVLSLYMSYTLDPWSRDSNTDFTLNNCLFGSVELTKNADRYKNRQSSYGIGFDSRSEFSVTDGSVGKRVNNV